MNKAPDAFRTISEVAAELDLPQHVLRFWESRFPQIKPMKRGGGRRYYRPDDVELLRGIRHLLYGQGYTIRGVQRILREQGPRFVQTVWQEGAPQPERQAEAEAEAESASASAKMRTSLTRRSRRPRRALRAKTAGNSPAATLSRRRNGASPRRLRTRRMRMPLATAQPPPRMPVRTQAGGWSRNLRRRRFGKFRRPIANDCRQRSKRSKLARICSTRP